MRLLPIHPFHLATPFDAIAAVHMAHTGPSEAHHNVNLLQRTSNDNTEAPDPRFWTSYDRFMLEREARAQRREYVYALIARLWRNLERRVRARRASSDKTGIAG